MDRLGSGLKAAKGALWQLCDESWKVGRRGRRARRRGYGRRDLG